MNRSKTYVRIMALVLICSWSSIVTAVQSNFWTSGDRTTLEQAEFEKIAITAAGTLTLAPQSEKLAEIDYPIFSVLELSDQKFILGTGDKSLLYRVTLNQEPVQLVDLDSFAVPALTRGPDQQIYVGNQKAQSIDIIKADGTLEKFYTIPEKYIWDMLWDKKGNLFVATGDQGKIYKITPSASGEVYFEADEGNIMRLALAPDGSLLAGSEGSGILYRISARNKAQILCDTSLAEISAIKVTPAGDIFFSAIPAFGPKLPLMTPPPTPQTSPEADKQENEKDNVKNSLDQLLQKQTPPKAFPKEGLASQLYYLPNDGTPRVIWTCPNQIIFDLALDEQGNVLVGTGEEAALYRLNKRFEPTLLYKFKAKHVICIETDAAGNLILGTASPGDLYRVNRTGNTYARLGEFFSEPIDAGVPSQWGTISFRADIPSGTDLKLFLRTGNSAVPDNTWGSWIPVSAKNAPASAAITRYAQWKCVMKSAQGLKTPHLYSFSIAYQQENLPPTIQKFFVQQNLNRQPGSSHTASKGLNNNNPNIFSKNDKNFWNNATYNRKTPKKQQALGLQKLKWRASDPNNDVLSFNLAIRALKQQKWITIENDLMGAQYDLDTCLLPDGQYEVRLVARDAPSNPESQTLEGEYFIPYLIIDNTPPELKVQKVTGPKKGKVSIQGVIKDDLSQIVSGEYSLNGQTWTLFAPQDSIYDQKQETFVIHWDDLAADDYFIIIRAQDIYDNTGRTLVTFTVAP